ncbi:hypothetical protein O0881_29015 [Janthinobacterium sp. SUN100]|uniref:hypothetical protein n=1 Tax=Janthinobacterium sp. SUN100 TaxID=3004101 RepID=UPI0025AFD39F|nr:hypothetical protein [Janthinobacterium sp. SUN100]MDN2706046.1 hypothetical protein [Janthinobacterium sp. SUN100]
MPSSTDVRNAHVIQFLVDKVFRRAILFPTWKRFEQRAQSETLFFDRAGWKESAPEKFYCHRSEKNVAVMPGKLFLVSSWPPTLDLKRVCARRINLFSVTVALFAKFPCPRPLFSLLQHGQGTLQ